MLAPRGWAFEQMEVWQPGSFWTKEEKKPNIIADYEFHKGRKTYASNVEGAYYSARLAVCEYLMKIKRQASAIIFREIGRDYQTPLGVWQIRENVRNALKTKPLTFSDLNLALKYLGTKLTVPLKYWQKESKVLDAIKNQKRIVDWL